MAIANELKPAILMIADVILPLDDWIKEPTKFRPDEPKPLSMPWRTSDPTKPKLTVENLGFFEHFDQLLTPQESFIDSYPVDLFLDRIAKGVDAPFAHWPTAVGDINMWRSARGLLPPVEAKIDPKLGDNVDFTMHISGKDHPATRAKFYDACWVQLTAVMALRKPSNRAEWKRLVTDFQEDIDTDDAPKAGSDPRPKTGWSPSVSGIKASAFIVALTRDLLTYALSNRCITPSGVPNGKDWISAVPIELGERRRPGNNFTAGDTEAAIAAMQKKIDDIVRIAAQVTGATK